MRYLLILVLLFSGCSAAKIRSQFEWARPRAELWDCKFKRINLREPAEPHAVWSCVKPEWD